MGRQTAARKAKNVHIALYFLAKNVNKKRVKVFAVKT